MEKDLIEKLENLSENLEKLHRTIEVPSESSELNNKFQDNILKDQVNLQKPPLKDSLNIKDLLIKFKPDIDYLRQKIPENFKELKKLKDERKVFLEMYQEKEKELKEVKNKTEKKEYIEFLEKENVRLKGDLEGWTTNVKKTENFIINEITIKTEPGKLPVNMKDNIFLKSLNNNPENSFIREKDEKFSEDNIREMLKIMDENNERNEKIQLSMDKANLESDFQVYKDNMEKIKNQWILDKATQKNVIQVLDLNQQKMANGCMKYEQKIMALKEQIEFLMGKMEQKERVLSDSMKENMGLREKLKAGKKNITNMKMENEVLNQKIKELIKKIEKNRDLEGKVKGFDKMSQDYEEKIKEIKTLKEGFLEEIKGFEAKNKEISKEFEGKIEGLNKEIENLMKKLEDSEENQKSINERLETHGNELEALKAEKNQQLKTFEGDALNKSQEIEDLKENIKELKEKMKKDEELLNLTFNEKFAINEAKFTEEIKEKDIKINDFEVKSKENKDFLIEKEKIIEDLLKKIKKSSEEIEKLEKIEDKNIRELFEKTKEIVNLNEIITLKIKNQEDILGKVMKLEEIVKMEVSEKESLRNLVKLSEENHKSLLIEIKEAQEKTKENERKLIWEIKEKMKENDALKEEIEVLKEKIKNSDKEREILNQKLEKSQENEKNLEENNEKLKKELETLKEEIKNLNDLSIKKTQEKAVFLEKIKQFEAQEKNSSHEIQNLSRFIDELQENIKKYIEKEKNLEEIKEKLKEEIVTLSDLINRKTKEEANFIEKIKNFEAQELKFSKEIQELRRFINELEEKIKNYEENKKNLEIFLRKTEENEKNIREKSNEQIQEIVVLTKEKDDLQAFNLNKQKEIEDLLEKLRVSEENEKSLYIQNEIKIQALKKQKEELEEKLENEKTNLLDIEKNLKNELFIINQEFGKEKEKNRFFLLKVIEKTMLFDEKNEEISSLDHSEMHVIEKIHRLSQKHRQIHQENLAFRLKIQETTQKIIVFSCKTQEKMYKHAQKLIFLQKSLHFLSSKKFWQNFFQSKINDLNFLYSVASKTQSNNSLSYHPFSELYYNFATNLLLHSNLMNYSELITKLYKGMLIFIELLKTFSMVLKSIMIDIYCNKKQDGKIINLFIEYLTVLEKINLDIEKTFNEGDLASKKNNVDLQIKRFQILIEKFFFLIENCATIKNGIFDLGKEILKRINCAIEEKSFQVVGSVFEQAQELQSENLRLKEEVFKLKSELVLK